MYKSNPVKTDAGSCAEYQTIVIFRARSDALHSLTA